MEEKLHYRCLNDLFAYCEGTPKEGMEKTESPIGLANGCTKTPETCGHYLKEINQHPTKVEIKKGG